MPLDAQMGGGDGKFGEQGGEQAHATMNAVKKSASGIRNNGKRLLFMLKQNLLSLSPQIQIVSCIDELYLRGCTKMDVHNQCFCVVNA